MYIRKFTQYVEHMAIKSVETPGFKYDLKSIKSVVMWIVFTLRYSRLSTIGKYPNQMMLYNFIVALWRHIAS